MDFNYTDEERLMLRIADEVAWTPGEKAALSDFLGWPVLVGTTRGERTVAVMEKIMEARLTPFLDLAKSLSKPYDVYMFTGADYQNGSDSARESIAEAIMDLLPKVEA